MIRFENVTKTYKTGSMALREVTVEIDTKVVKIKTDARAFVETNLLSGAATVHD